MNRPTRPTSPTHERTRVAAERDFTLRRGAHLYRLRADGRSEGALLREIRSIAHGDAPARRAA